MKDYIEERVLELAHYIVNTNSTVRAAAKKFRVSKSTVHTVVGIRNRFILRIRFHHDSGFFFTL